MMILAVAYFFGATLYIYGQNVIRQVRYYEAKMNSVSR